MAMTKDQQEQWAAWRAHCERTQTLTAISVEVAGESDVEKSRRIERLLRSYPDFCAYYFGHFMQKKDKEGNVVGTIPNAPFHNKAAKVVKNTPNLKAVFKWPRGHAKSSHFDIFLPIWLMMQRPRLLNVMVVVGKSEESAQTLLSDLQAELEFNQRIIADFGPQRGAGNWMDGEFVTRGDVAFFARGRGQSPRGLRYKQSRPDYIVIDDLDDDELCRNEKRVQELTDWVKEALFGSLDVGRGRFIMVGNLISKNSVLQKMCDTPGVHVSEVKALDKEGNPVWADKWTREEAEEARAFMGYRAWEKEMMHNPITEGSIFRNDWIRYTKTLPLDKYDDLVCYTDPSFRSSGNDYKACRLWGRKGSNLHLIDTYCKQDTVGHMVRWLYDLYERTIGKAAVRFYMEANFMQDIILDEFAKEGETRGYQLPIMPDKRKKPDKVQRIEAVSPLWERGFVFYNEAKRDDPDMMVGIEQTLAIAHGSRQHDDAPDADEGAIYILQQAVRARQSPVRADKRPTARNIW